MYDSAYFLIFVVFNHPALMSVVGFFLTTLLRWFKKDLFYVRGLHLLIRTNLNNRRMQKI